MRRILFLGLFGIVLSVGCGRAASDRLSASAGSAQQQSIVQECIPEGSDCTDSGQCCGYDVGCYCWYDPSHGICSRTPCID